MKEIILKECNSHPEHWKSIIQILSLDCALPLWEYMNLRVETDTQEVVKKIARQTYLKLRADANDFYSIDSSSGDFKNTLIVFFETLNEMSSNTTLQNLIDWKRKYYVHTVSACAVAYQWQLAFLDLSNEYPFLKSRLSLANEKLEELILWVKSEMVNSPAYNLLETAAPSTDWDHQIFQDGQIDDDEVFYALDHVHLIVDMQNFYRVWSMLLQKFQQSDMEMLLLWYGQQRKEIVQQHPELLVLPTAS